MAVHSTRLRFSLWRRILIRIGADRTWLDRGAGAMPIASTSMAKLTNCFGIVVLLLVLATPSRASSHNEVTIWARLFGPWPVDDGGYIHSYVAAIAAANDAGTLVVIEGTCLSACTIKLAAKNRCVRPNAILWFHSATAKAAVDRATKSSFVSEDGNAVLIRSYPPQVRREVLRRHMLDNVAFDPEHTLTGRELLSLGEKECENSQR